MLLEIFEARKHMVSCAQMCHVKICILCFAVAPRRYSQGCSCWFSIADLQQLKDLSALGLLTSKILL